MAGYEDTRTLQARAKHSHLEEQRAWVSQTPQWTVWHTEVPLSALFRWAAKAFLVYLVFLAGFFCVVFLVWVVIGALILSRFH